jgi:hypothetical protein
MKTQSWFRVVVDAQGKVTDCKPVSSAGAADSGIFYDVLEEVRAAWRQHNTVGGFTRWLENEIASLKGRKVA